MQRILGLLAISFTALFSCSAHAETVIFDQVRILTMTDSGPIERGHVIITDDQIEAVASGPAPDREGARIIDGSGRTLMPGLHDMHVHYYDRTDGLLFIANSVTTVRNLTGSHLQFRFDEAARNGQIVGPRVVTSGAILDGPGSYLRDGGMIIENAELATGAVRAQHAAGFPAIKLYEFLDAETYRAAAAEAERLEMQIYSHTPGSLSVGDLLDIGVDSIEHLDGYETVLVREDFTPRNIFPWAEQWSNLDSARVAEWARLTAASQTFNVPTFVLNLRQLDARNPDAFFAQAEAAYVDPERAAGWIAMDGWMRQFDDFAQSQYDGKIAFGRALREAGARLLIGTDTPNPYIIPGFSIHDELTAFAQIGFSNTEILHKATTEAAAFLGYEGLSGIIAAGANANLVLLDADPRSDLATLRRPAGVMVGGHWRDREELDRLLERRRTAIEGQREAAQAHN